MMGICDKHDSCAMNGSVVCLNCDGSMLRYEKKANQEVAGPVAVDFEMLKETAQYMIDNKDSIVGINPHKVLRLCIEYEEREKINRWIPVGERLPENIATVWVLLYAEATESLCPSMGFYGEGDEGWGWEILGPGILTKVTHWKPIILPGGLLDELEKGVLRTTLGTGGRRHAGNTLEAAYKQGFEDAKKVILKEVQKLGKR